MKEKITFACTTFNEEKNIIKFLDSISNQSIKPQEIIIVDGGSKDKTVEIIKDYKTKSKIPISLFIVPGNIAKGRNEYIRRTRTKILFTGDLGTRFEKDWIKKLLIGFDKGADIIIGTYLSEKPVNLLEKIIASRFPDFSKFSEEDWNHFLPSNRQIAFKVSSWKKLGEFPEWMDRADDTLMHMKAKEIGMRYYFAKNAKVYWHARNNLKEYLRLAYEDSISDGISGIIWKRKIYLAQLAILGILALTVPFSRMYTPYFLLLWPILIGGIFLKEGFSIYKKTKDIKAFFYGGVIMIELFFAHSIGGLLGLLKSFFVKRNN
jgi:glycosyltransferase involved in cell wall biosynthesis